MLVMSVVVEKFQYSIFHIDMIFEQIQTNQLIFMNSINPNISQSLFRKGNICFVSTDIEWIDDISAYFRLFIFFQTKAWLMNFWTKKVNSNYQQVYQHCFIFLLCAEHIHSLVIIFITNYFQIFNSQNFIIVLCIILEDITKLHYYYQPINLLALTFTL